MEIAGPDKAQHGAGEAADKAHQDRKVRDKDCHHDRSENDR